ncbi:MAG: hypothetical protein ABI450_09155, partial [Rhizomicrobium sp.]
KDPVRLRWLGEQIRGRRFTTAFMALDTWMLSTAAALTVGLVLALVLASGGAVNFALAMLAMLGFLIRDVAIFVAMRALAGNKGDFAALAALGVLYLLLPMVLRGLGLSSLAFLLTPILTSAAVLGVPAAWIQGIAAVWLAARSIAAKLPSR